MLVRSPRKLALLCLVAVGFMAVVLHQAPWTRMIGPMVLLEQRPSVDGVRKGVGGMWDAVRAGFGVGEGSGVDAPGGGAGGNGYWNHEHSVQDTVGGVGEDAVGEQLESEKGKELEWEAQRKKQKQKQKQIEEERGNLSWWEWIDTNGEIELTEAEKEAGKKEVGVLDWKTYMKQMLEWPRPTWEGHWPPFKDYVDREYDPNRWEYFPLDNGIFNATIDTLPEAVASSPRVYNPLPDYDSVAYKRKWRGAYVSCRGPRGVNLNVSNDDQVYVYNAVPESFPEAYAGGYDIVGLNDSVCFDRYGRYGAYGLGADKEVGSVHNWDPPAAVDWENVDWGSLQDECFARNSGRYHLHAIGGDAGGGVSVPGSQRDMSSQETTQDEKEYHPRTALLIRTWTGYTYTPNDVISIRSLISELSLQSGSEYSVYLLVHVKDVSLDISDPAIAQHLLDTHVPSEFHSISILWSENLFPELYPGVGDWQVYWQQFMVLQWFSANNPEFDFVWNWETDARYIGHHYHFLSTLDGWATAQPTKYLNERNKRFYFPTVHGESYAAYIANTHAEINGSTLDPVWGSRPYLADQQQHPLHPAPERNIETDAFTHGVGTPADLITLLPIWDPRNTSWSYKDKIWNFVPGVAPQFTPTDPHADAFTHPEFGGIERRVFINTVARFSRGLLERMDAENRAGRSMQAEMWPASVALMYGGKSVAIPHPIFTDRVWEAEYTKAIFDDAHDVNELGGPAGNDVEGKDAGSEARWTEGQDSPYNHDREYNFFGWSWYFADSFARNIYKRWLGHEVVVQEWGEPGRVVKGSGFEGEREEGRMCVRGVVLHPVKGMGEG